MRSAFRSLLGAPGYTVAALVTLALGIGLNTSVVSLIDALLYRPAPFAAPDTLFHPADEVALIPPVSGG